MSGGCCVDGDSYLLTREMMRGYDFGELCFADGFGVASRSEDEFDG